MSKEDFSFTYPESGGVQAISVGETTLDFLEGVARSPKGEKTDIASSLGAIGRLSCRSILIQTDQALVISLDTRRGKRGGKFTIDANKYTRIPHQLFDMLYLTATTSTNIKVWASTHPEGVPIVGLTRVVIEDLSGGNQTNDVKVTLDGEKIKTLTTVPDGYTVINSLSGDSVTAGDGTKDIDLAALINTMSGGTLTGVIPFYILIRFDPDDEASIGYDTKLSLHDNAAPANTNELGGQDGCHIYYFDQNFIDLIQRDSGNDIGDVLYLSVDADVSQALDFHWSFQGAYKN